MTLPGPGDSATWGPVTDPRDPRYTDPCDLCNIGSNYCRKCPDNPQNDPPEDDE